MFLKNISTTYQSFSYNGGVCQRTIAPNETATIIDANEDDISIKTLLKLGYVEVVEDPEKIENDEEPAIFAVLDNESGQTPVSTTVMCSGTYKDGNPCTTVISLGDGESYEDAPRFCGRHKKEDPSKYEIVNGSWKKTGGAGASQDPDDDDRVAVTSQTSSDDDSKVADGDGDDGVDNGDKSVAVPVAPASATPVFDNN